MIKVTEAAAKQILQQEKIENTSLRIAGKINPDGTYEYGMGFDEVKEDDVKITSERVSLIVAPECREMLEDTVLDYVELEGGAFGFIFFNPNDPDHKAPKG
ncbi:MAG: iron-sulfur cluster assembly accessory protein [Gammaproteobacteria bacterium]|nr:iron-sulfur cluster assembly accessory protein [Gammaproteobacteria bacterium]